MKRKNDLNVFTYSYYGNIFQRIRQFFRNIKYAWQRATKGYCDQDVWNLNWFYVELIRDSIKELAEITHGYPGDDTKEGKSYKAWKSYLEKISLLMDRSIDRSFAEDQYYKNPYEDEYQKYLENPVHFQWEEMENGCRRLVDNDTKEDRALKKKYFNQEKKMYLKRKKDRDQAFDMIKERWDSLWD